MHLPHLTAGWPETCVSAALAFLVPLVLAAIGECFTERAGVINIGIEGIMLAAALASVSASHATGSCWVGLACGVAAALALGALFGGVAVYTRADQVVAGTGLNLLSLGLTGSIFFTMTQQAAAHGASRIVGIKLPDWPVPLLESLPAFGPTLFHGNLLVYLSLFLVPAADWSLRRTTLGLQLRAVGEHPRAAEAAGVNVRRYRYSAVLAGAALAGAAGCYLAIGHVVTFAPNMTAGKGFIALALVIFGRWNPWGVLAGAVVFSFAWGITAVLSTQGRGRPEEVLLFALPYLATLAVLLLRTGKPARSASPAALGQPYVHG